MTFDLQYTDSKSNARAGLITTDHGQIETPIFMPVGTVGTVKGVHVTELKEDIKAQIILGNTYHLYLRPGLDVLEKAGGLHKFNGFDRPMLTDSGGFQVFSLSGIRKLREEGAEFRSHIDGSKHIFTPEKVMDIERTIGADIMMAFDECPPGDSDYAYAKKSLGLTHRWLDRCIQRFNETEPKYGYQQSLFPIVQGCVYPDLRKQSVPMCYVLIGKPGINVSTKFVYGNLHLDEVTEHPDIDGMVEAIRNHDLYGITDRMGNVLESVTCPAYPVIDEIKAQMMKNGAVNAMMSGSGPTVFGIFDDPDKAEFARAQLKISGLSKQTFLTTVSKPGGTKYGKK